MYKIILFFILSTIGWAQNIANINIGLGRYDQEELSRYKVKPLGPGIELSLEKSLEPLMSLNYGLFFGMDYLSSEIKTDNVENKIKQKNIKFGLTLKYTLFSAFALSFAYGLATIDHSLKEEVDEETRVALTNIYGLKDGAKSSMLAYGIQYNFDTDGAYKKTYISFQKINYNKFESSQFQLSVGMTWEMSFGSY